VSKWGFKKVGGGDDDGGKKVLKNDFGGRWKLKISGITTFEKSKNFSQCLEKSKSRFQDFGKDRINFETLKKTSFFKQDP
jgi:hypothetical protein